MAKIPLFSSLHYFPKGKLHSSLFSVHLQMANTETEHSFSDSELFSPKCAPLPQPLTWSLFLDLMEQGRVHRAIHVTVSRFGMRI